MLPVPLTVCVQVEVCVVEIDVGEQLTATDVIVFVAVEEPPLPPPQPAATVRTPTANGRTVTLHATHQAESCPLAANIWLPPGIAVNILLHREQQNIRKAAGGAAFMNRIVRFPGGRGGLPQGSGSSPPKRAAKRSLRNLSTVVNSMPCIPNSTAASMFACLSSMNSASSAVTPSFSSVCR